MPWDGTGIFVPIGAPDYPAVPGETILADRFNAVIDDLIAGLNNCVTRDYQEGDFWLSTTDPDAGAALVGYGSGLAYPIGTVGDALNTLFEAEKDLLGTANQVTVTETDPETLTLSFPTAVTFPGTARSVGVTDGGNSAAGYVGEYFETTVAVGTALTTGTNVDLGTLVLPAGDYFVGGTVAFDPSSGFIYTYLMGWIGTAAITPAGFPNQALQWGDPGGAALTAGMHATDAAFALPMRRISVNAPTTLYLGAKSVFSAGTLNAGGRIFAWRMR